MKDWELCSRIQQAWLTLVDRNASIDGILCDNRHWVIPATVQPFSDNDTTRWQGMARAFGRNVFTTAQRAGRWLGKFGLVWQKNWPHLRRKMRCKRTKLYKRRNLLKWIGMKLFRIVLGWSTCQSLWPVSRKIFQHQFLVKRDTVTDTISTFAVGLDSRLSQSCCQVRQGRNKLACFDNPNGFVSAVPHLYT